MEETEHFSADSSTSIESRVKDFTKLLDKIDGLIDNKKQLWREIYQNAITDRQNAWLMFDELVSIVHGKTTEHAVHGRALASYLERMNKANDQLIKLAELVAKAEDASSDDDDSPDKLYDRIGRGAG
jgi:hypothetical protein